MGCFCFLIKKLLNKQKAIPVSESTSCHTTNSASDSVSSFRSTPYIFEDKSNNLRVFEYKELRNATNDFNRLLKIGEGGFGSVYKGLINSQNSRGDRTTVAVKKLDQNGLQGHKQWLAEVQFLGVLEHPNLVKLIGYCAVDDEKGAQRLLVYEYVPNKSLDDHLFNHTYPSLEWNARLKIALGAAEGLAYLHGLEVQVIYRDFKASNVLLDKDFRPKLSDFGLAREGPLAGDTHVSTAVMGTYGYAAPDYIETGHLTDKSDVWSFGVVLYEILTGRKSMDRNRPRHEQKLLDWVKRYPVESIKFGRIMDPRLQNLYSMKAAKEIAKLANLCLSKHAKDRPKMREVVDGIKQAMQYTEMDGHAHVLYECEFELDDENTEDNNGSSKNSESMKRRMHHLSKLNESANDVGRRRLFMLLKIND